jgi:hypothetical protein
VRGNFSLIEEVLRYISLSANMAKIAILDDHLKTLSAKDAKNSFGMLIDTARAEPVTIEKHGRAAKPITPKCGRIGMRTFFRMPWFSLIVE